MKIRLILAMMAALFLMVGCFSSSDDDDNGSSDLGDRDRAEAAASASVLSGALNDPEDDDDDDGEGYGPMGQMAGAANTMNQRCDSGTLDEGETPGKDVGSPYTEGGTVDVSWTYYDSCVQGEGEDFEMTTDGYQEQNAQFGDVGYFRWAATPDDPMGEEGPFMMDSGFGSFQFSGYMHDCEQCNGNQFGSVGAVTWEIESEGESVVFEFGRSDDPFEVEGQWLSDSDAEQSVSGYYGLNWEGTPCNLDVEYETVEPLYFQDYQTSSEQIISGQMNLSIGDSTFHVEYIDGQAYIDGDLVEPDVDNPCAGAFQISIGM
ncbi:hypothetical protein J2T60_000469 [Natronospira proteinivora]|uniref:Lipoprotein n=1 Tax=Natronospira proteinivora TaxID=1807133 RepID=A0ABT1G5D7_9GAMM|nr:hypothetical protein [Natronospira proteinivora]MCP1726504.1 hypothetical protein [Natronospira proteinivora]